MEDDKKFPSRLYVTEEPVYLGYPTTPELRHLVGTGHLESAVPDNNKEKIVAVYELIRVEKYKKTVTRTSVVEKVY
jgi:hypothetical protein